MNSNKFERALEYAYSKRLQLDSISFDFAGIVDESLKSPIKNAKRSILESENEYERLMALTSEEVERKGGVPTPEDQEAIEDAMMAGHESHRGKEHLSVLLQMKVVYLFRCIETTLKEIAEIAYPGTKTKELYKWENMKAFYSGKEIDLSKIEGYQEVIELKKVNNNIKHSSIVSEEVHRIVEFSDSEGFHEIPLETFLDRISTPVRVFMMGITNDVQRDLYEFNETRLERIANEYAERMNKEAAEIFTAKLLAKCKKIIV
jgi:hypothetical protein